MRLLPSLPFHAAASALFCATALLSSSALQAQSSAITPRITANVDESSLTTLKGNVPQLARAEFDQGEAPGSTQMSHLRLVLQRSSEQQASLDAYLAELQDKSSPNYHKWLTPTEFGQLYGPADSDVAALVAWLESHGLKVETVSKGRTNIAFSGEVSQVEEAFHTTIHSFQANGNQFYSNTTDPQIPAALVPVVKGVAHLNTIRPRPLSVHGNPGRINPETKRLEPLNAAPSIGPRANLSGGSGTTSNPYVLYLVPGDAATIYDTPNSFNANFAGGTSYTGAGVNIGVGGDAIISASIVQTYRSLFLGSSYATAPILKYCTASNSCSSTPGSGYVADDAVEAYIDTELSGGMAPGATIYYYASPSNDGTLGIEAALDDNKVDIFSLSFGECESEIGSSGNSQINGWWEQAAGQGIAVMVSSGDSGSAGCDETTTDNNRTVTQATGGLQVSGYSSTPYNISVGGTDFYLLWVSDADFETYVSTSLGTAGAPTYYRTAKSYIPESTWNDSTYSDTTISANEPWTAISGDTGFANIVGGAGGASAVYTKPSWQSATGVPSDGKRDLPDISLMAGNEFDDAVWAICDDASDPSAFSPYPNAVLDCSSISAGDFDAYGGTSTSSPSFAGILAMVEQKTGSRLGLPAQTLYSLYGTAPAAFHDITVGNNSVPCKSSSANCDETTNTSGYYFESGYNTTAGYDLATGLGSVDATKLVNAWTSATGSDTATVTFTSISPNPATTIENITVVVTVSGSHGTPAGTVTLTGGSYNSGAQALSGGSYTFTVPAGDLPIGTSDTLTANYSGNSTYATATNSATVTVTGLTAKVTASPTPSSINSNQTVIVAGTVSCTGSCAGSTTPTGTVALTGGGYTSPATALSGTGSYSITIPYNSLSAGNDTLTVTYSGNSTYDAGAFGTTSVDVTFVAVLTPMVTVTPASSSVDSSQSLNVTVAVTGSGATPTGTVTLTSGSYNSGVVTFGSSGCTAASCVITIPGNSLNVGNDTLTATYSGDPVYASGVGTAPVTVTQSAFALAATTPSAIATPGGSTTSTVTVSSHTFYTGTVTLTCSLTSYPVGAVYSPYCSFTSGSTVSMSAGTPTPTSSTATVTTTAASSELVYPKMPGRGRGWVGAGGGAVLALLVFLGIPARRRSWRQMLGVLVMMAALGSLASCGGGSIGGSGGSGIAGTTPGSYVFTVTGTGNDSANTTGTAKFTVTVN